MPGMPRGPLVNSCQLRKNRENYDVKTERRQTVIIIVKLT